MRTLLLVCLSALTAGAVHGAEPASAAIPLEQFTKHDEFGTLKISPDGTHLAMTTGRRGAGALVFFSLKEQEVTGGVRAPEPYLIHDFHWVSPTRAIYMLAERFVGRAAPSFTGEMFAVDLNGASHRPIFGYRVGEETIGTKLPKRESTRATPTLISTLDEDRDEILITQLRWKCTAQWCYPDTDAQPEIVRLNVYTGDTRSLGIVPLRNARVLVDHEDRVRFAMGRNEAFKMTLSWRPDPNGPWTEFDLPGFREDSLWPAGFTADDRAVLLGGVREGDRVNAVHRLDLQTMAVEKLLGFEDRDTDRVVRDFARRDVIGAKSVADQPMYQWLDKNHPAAKLHISLHKAFPNQDVSVTSASKDGGIVILFVTSDTNPGEFYQFDTRTRKADFLRAARAWIDSSRMRPKEPFQIDARDGLKLHGYVTQPAGAGPHPLVVVPNYEPSGSGVRDGFDGQAQLFASRGFAVLQVNQRGVDRFGMDFENAGHRQWGQRMQDDVTDATRWAVEQKIAQAGRICLFGAGWYGGYAALMGLAKEPELYRCAIGVDGAYDLPLLHADATATSQSSKAYVEKWVGIERSLLDEVSPANLAQRIKANVMLVHGKEDRFVTFEQAKRMKGALEAQGKRPEWMPLSGEMGGFIYDEKTRLRVYERALQFLDENLRAVRATAQ